MEKKGQGFVAALGGAGGVIFILVVIFLIYGSQQVEVRQIDVSIEDNQIITVNYTTSKISRFTLWFDSQPSGFYTIEITDKMKKKVIESFESIGGFDFSFYLNNPLLQDCIGIKLKAYPSERELDSVTDICINEGGKTWNGR